LIAADLGATVPFGQKKYNGVFINSFGLNESSYLLGAYLNNKGYKSICSSTCYYDAGYGFLSAIQASFNNDINFAGHYITPHTPRENEVQYMESVIGSANPDAVFCFHSGLFAEEHAGFIMDTDLTEKYPYYALPFTYNEKMLEKANRDNFFLVAS